MPKELMIELKGDVYNMNKRGPNTELCSTPQSTSQLSKKYSLVFNTKVLLVKYDWNQLRARPSIPNHFDNKLKEVYDKLCQKLMENQEERSHQ